MTKESLDRLECNPEHNLVILSDILYVILKSLTIKLMVQHTELVSEILKEYPFVADVLNVVNSYLEWEKLEPEERAQTINDLMNTRK